jgi:hypothetical protein
MWKFKCWLCPDTKLKTYFKRHYDTMKATPVENILLRRFTHHRRNLPAECVGVAPEKNTMQSAEK